MRMKCVRRRLAVGVTRDEDGKPVFKLRMSRSFDALKGSGKASK